jgi:hypothetical protein
MLFGFIVLLYFYMFYLFYKMDQWILPSGMNLRNTIFAVNYLIYTNEVIGIYWILSSNSIIFVLFCISWNHYVFHCPKNQKLYWKHSFLYTKIKISGIYLLLLVFALLRFFKLFINENSHEMHRICYMVNDIINSILFSK